jgi:hypothetical protein
MSIDKNKIKTQDELDEPAPMDQAEQRVEAEMKKLEGQAKKEVAEGLRQQDEDDTNNQPFSERSASSSAALIWPGVRSGLKPIKRRTMRPSRAITKLCGIEAASLHQRLRDFALGPADLVVNFVFTDEVAHALGRRFRIFSRESNHLDAATLILLVKFDELGSFHPAWATPRRPQVNQ